MKTARIALITFVGLMTASRTEAAPLIAPLFSTTDLGSSYQLKTDSAGHVYGVANADGSAVYAFDKSPVTAINLNTNTPSQLPDSAYVYTMQNQDGSHRVGYVTSNSTALGDYLRPTLEPVGSGWYTRPGQSPVNDINVPGQAVGTSLNPSGTGNYAAFSDVTGLPHGVNASVTDNLNNYVATMPGVTLTSAVKVDDLGRILAIGSNGHDYLVNKEALGSPSPVPEPTTTMMIVLVGSLLGVRAIRRRSQK